MKEFSLRWWICWTIYGVVYHPITMFRAVVHCAAKIAGGTYGCIANRISQYRRGKEAIRIARPIVEWCLVKDAEREAERLDRLRNPHKYRLAE
jgi:hypothetical protein